VSLPPPLLVLSPGTLHRGRPGDAASAALAGFPALAREALAAGARGILLREPSLEDGAFLELALELRALLDSSSAGGWLGVHDRLHLAAAARADGVQLAGVSLTPLEARRVVGEEVTIGVSTHEGDTEERWAGADLALHAPVFPPRSKSVEAQPLGPEGLRAFCATCPLPVWALGGVDAERVRELSGTGAAGAAAIGAVWGVQPGTRGAAGGTASPGVDERVRALVASAAAAFGSDEGVPG